MCLNLSIRFATQGLLTYRSTHRIPQPVQNSWTPTSTLTFPLIRKVHTLNRVCTSGIAIGTLTSIDLMISHHLSIAYTPHSSFTKIIIYFFPVSLPLVKCLWAFRKVLNKMKAYCSNAALFFGHRGSTR